ncbi:class I SAM-dependent methyltransferase [Catenulispora pinisilvae]|uniref:class I SAM-dependent methyltransferase n=1 Tax=Catenulispora pinisilvae TaxID=2705253 RepID=UPI001E50F9DC|nr:class I SAM-dependent methyltransferase [Catenulispora pinisilvae]
MEHSHGSHGHGSHGGHHPGDESHGAHHPEDEASMADVLDLDAEVVRPYLDELTAWAAGHAETAPRTILDIGAGTGTGTLALARRFASADLAAVDRSPGMLDRLQAAAAAAGIADRLRTVQADLDSAWPAAAIGTADLAWASSSLHHVADPDRVLANVHGALNPGGLLVVVEMDAMPRFLPDGVYPGMEERCRRAAAGKGWNAWPNWTGHLERAGFTVAEERTFAIDLSPAPPAANRLAHRILGGMRGRLADQLPLEDIAALDRLLDPADEEFVLRRSDLEVRSARTAWAALRLTG